MIVNSLGRQIAPGTGIRSDLMDIKSSSHKASPDTFSGARRGDFMRLGARARAGWAAAGRGG